LNLPASWYIARPSPEVKDRPKAVELFGRQLVMWRDAGGRPVLMTRRCPHMGANLAEGKIVNGSLQCPLHHWRFDAAGACVHVSGPRRDRAARRLAYPTVERYGYIWAWYGSPEPMFPLPEMPALAIGRPRYKIFRFSGTTRAAVRRVMENIYQPDHLAPHGLEAARPFTLRLTHPEESKDHGPPIAPGAWFGAELSWPGSPGRFGIVPRPLGRHANRIVLRVDGWPAGQRISCLADGVLQYQLLLAVAPIAENKTIQHITVAIERTGRFWRDLWAYPALRAKIQAAANQVLPISGTTGPGGRHDADITSDNVLLRFRRHYQSWVERVAAQP
jgi:aminopyrrolnitrin oxygenase